MRASPLGSLPVRGGLTPLLLRASAPVPVAFKGPRLRRAAAQGPLAAPVISKIIQDMITGSWRNALTIDT